MGATLFTNGAVLTQRAPQPRGRSLLVAADRIVAVFDEPEPDLVWPGGLRTIDLAGRCVLPGFNDAHIHFIDWGFALAELDLNPTRAPEEVARLVAETVATRPKGEVILGAGWSHNLWPGGKLPNSTALLDRAAPDHPVLLESKCGHLAWLNGAALRAAGIDAKTAPPTGGVIDLGADGRPTGILKEHAIRLARRIMPPRDAGAFDAALDRATREAHRLGVTAIHSVETLDDFAAFQRAARAGELGVRVHFFVPEAHFDHMRDLRLAGLPQDGRLTVGGIKLFTDGSLGGRTAWFGEPYADDPSNVGVPLYEPEALNDLVRRATEARVACAIHAIGDAAIAMVLDAFELARTLERERFPGEPPLLHRIEHFQTPRPADVPRAARLGIAASMQPVHLFADWAPADEYLGERAAMTYALRTIRDAGVLAPFGSDAPVETVEVPKSLHAAVNRQDLARRPEGGWRRDEAVTVAEALEAHTLLGARLAGDAHRRGWLGPGAVADLVVLNSDPTAIPREELLDLEVEATFVDGACVFGAERLDTPAIARA